ncbi:hypothetical protein NHF41_09560 [Pseudomonas proteolytica]|nr:hypothetical protein [Pseudomonas proteolytica]USX02034.1 hypothetical protein NHF41_09560 [Pseudomonas proteolytica]
MQGWQTGGGREPGVGEHIDLQLHLLAHHHLRAGQQLHLHLELRLARP